MGFKPEGYIAPTRTGRPFIAYERKQHRVPGPDGQTVTARPSVHVRELVDIKVRAFDLETTESPDRSFTTGRVELDAKSIGMKHHFSASVQAGSKAAELLAAAHVNGTPVTVTIETSRRGRPQAGGDRISRLTPIQVLRGITGDVTTAQAEITHRNCRVLVVGVNGQFTDELVCDPGEFELLRENHDGLLAPPGWAAFEGAIIPAVDVAAQVVEGLKRYYGDSGHAQGTARQGRPPVRSVGSSEGKPWDQWNSDRRFNHGSYLATSIRETHTMAHALLVAAGVDPLDDRAYLKALTQLLLELADRIQQGVQSDGMPKRMDRSHREAREWIAHVVATVPALQYTAAMADPADPEAIKARNAWAKAVIAAAKPLMASVEQIAESTRLPVGSDGLPVIAPLANDAPLKDRFQSLLSDPQVRLGKYRDRTYPLLTERFGTHEPEQIEAALFAEALSEWEADPAAFLEAARAAAQQATEPSAAA